MPMATRLTISVTRFANRVATSARNSATAAEAASPSRESLERHFAARARSLSVCAERALERAAADVREFVEQVREAGFLAS